MENAKNQKTKVIHESHGRVVVKSVNTQTKKRFYFTAKKNGSGEFLVYCGNGMHFSSCSLHDCASNTAITWVTKALALVELNRDLFLYDGIEEKRSFNGSWMTGKKG